MDRNSAIGLTLIAALLVIYFYWFSPNPAPPVNDQPVATQPSATVDSTRAQAPATAADSAFVASFGDLSAFAAGQQSNTTIETQKFRISFSNKGAVINGLELKTYKTYWQTPLYLITPESSTFSLKTTYKGKDIDLYQLFYKPEQTRKGDTTIVSFSLRLENGSSLTHTYSIPDNGYEIRYNISQNGLIDNLNGEQLTFEWNDRMLALEKDIVDTRENSTVNYFEVQGGFDGLSERSDSEAEQVAGGVKWIAMKRKFFLSSIIAENAFSGGQFSTTVNPADTLIVEHAAVRLGIPKKDLAAGAAFKFYFGPNDYQVIGKVAEDFSRNVYLGWPPIYWINKYAIFPVFHFLTTFISNYGLIIIILVILLKLVLFPLSYKSFLSMAKMKVLKPELDEIKERNGDDMTKTQQDQLKLYQQVGVNPISGCIPVLLQMPLIFAMFYLFPASIELRQQPFLWAEDLSTYDSLIQLGFAVPFLGSHISLFTVLMTAATLLYTWQNNQMSSVTGPMKAMSYAMPIIFFFMLNRFSAGLTFYYFISTVFTFIQQAIIRRFVDENKIKMVLEENRKRNLSGNSKKSKFMSKLEEAMKASEEARKRTEEERKKKKK